MEVAVVAGLVSTHHVMGHGWSLTLNVSCDLDGDSQMALNLHITAALKSGIVLPLGIHREGTMGGLASLPMNMNLC